jgi:thiol-disulfide isomerase/thioredoxin
MDGMLVVRFYATWCRSCKQIAPVFYKLARALPGITFVEVPINDENINLHHGLGVPSVPFAHIYYHGVLAEELKLNKRHFPRFLYHVKAYVRGRCMLPEDGDCSDPFPNEEEESLDTYS